MDNPFELMINEIRELKSLVALNSAAADHAPVYLKIDKAAEYLSTSEAALRIMAHKGVITYIKKQGKLFFRQSDLIEWMESGEVKSNGLVPEDILVTNKKRS